MNSLLIEEEISSIPKASNTTATELDLTPELWIFEQRSDVQHPLPLQWESLRAQALRDLKQTALKFLLKYEFQQSFDVMEV
ncbi:hypothetical protein KY285_018530 [Solanum tuberosum]|nr:hypothetical protein KY289_016113 [Solanum tuberosum]KAH0704252.1 hypothetical protein KY285_018530 [Solanum tuberosum]